MLFYGRVIFKYDGYVLSTDVVGQFGDFTSGVIKDAQGPIPSRQ